MNGGQRGLRVQLQAEPARTEEIAMSSFRNKSMQKDSLYLTRMISSKTARQAVGSLVSKTVCEQVSPRQPFKKPEQLSGTVLDPVSCKEGRKGKQ